MSRQSHRFNIEQLWMAGIRSPKQIAQETGCHILTARKWVRYFSQEAEKNDLAEIKCMIRGLSSAMNRLESLLRAAIRRMDERRKEREPHGD